MRSGVALPTAPLMLHSFPWLGLPTQGSARKQGAERYGRQFWTGMVGKGAESKLGTAKEVVITCAALRPESLVLRHRGPPQ